MHSYEINKSVFHHNGDYSGDVIIYHDGEEFEIPMVDLLEFVAGYVRHMREVELDEMTAKEVLGVRGKRKR